MNAVVAFDVRLIVFEGGHSQREYGKYMLFFDGVVHLEIYGKFIRWNSNVSMSKMKSVRLRSCWADARYIFNDIPRLVYDPSAS